MYVIKAPSKSNKVYPRSIFLAGGITKCEDWQTKVSDALMSIDGNLFNPRRDVMPTGIFEITRQIEWEYYWIRHVDIVAFWFAPETLNPITLFELGSALNRKETQKLIVAVHPKYQRRFDVITQCRLANQVVYVGFKEFIQQIKQELDLI